MKLLFTDETTTHYDKYYLCESEEEYNEQLAKSRANRMARVTERLFQCHPKTTVSDGYAIHGGREFEADGFEYWYEMGGICDRMTKSNYYIKPNGIIKDEIVKPKEWWVA